MGINDIKQAIRENRLPILMAAGAAIGLGVAGPLVGVPVGIGWGVISLGAVKVAEFAKDTYQALKNPEPVKVEEGKEPLDAKESTTAKAVHFKDPVSSYARALAAGIPAGNNLNHIGSRVLTPRASPENFAADLPFSPVDDEAPNNDVFEVQVQGPQLGF